MLIEGLGNVSFINGILRIQTLKVNSDGQVAESGVIEIPGNKVGDVINGMATAAKGISDKLDTNAEEANKANEEPSNGKENKKGFKKKK